MPDIHGAAMFVGDRVQIIRMDEAYYSWLIGATGVVVAIPNQAPTTQVMITLDDQSRLSGLSTQQSWLQKI